MSELQASSVRAVRDELLSADTDTAMATMESMRKEMDQMKDFILRQEDEIVRLKKINRLSNEDLSALEGESVLGQRLYDMEMELSEQKISTTKITKLCMSAINALERIEEKPGELKKIAV